MLCISDARACKRKIILYFLGFFPQYDKKGRNYLHRAILNGDIETVLFLISVSANIHTPVQDSSLTTPLHLAVQTGSEIIVRHLVHCRTKTLSLLCSLYLLSFLPSRNSQSHGEKIERLGKAPLWILMNFGKQRRPQTAKQGWPALGHSA